MFGAGPQFHRKQAGRQGRWLPRPAVYRSRGADFGGRRRSGASSVTLEVGNKTAPTRYTYKRISLPQRFQ
jgi:hypothetical protein